MPATSSVSRRFSLKMDLTIDSLRTVSSQYWEDPRAAELYPAWLTVMHSVTRSAIALMQEALGECVHRYDSDPLCRGFAGYLTKHLGEEYGHDRWVEEDIEACGRNLVPYRDAPARAEIANLVGSQYYWIRHEHPIALLGHIAVLEGYPPGPGFVPGLVDRTGYDISAFRTFSRHEVLDRRHGREARQALDDLPIPPEREALIGLSGLHSIATLRDIFVATRSWVANRPDGTTRPDSDELRPAPLAVAG